jgi:hypothetical protein
LWLPWVNIHEHSSAEQQADVYRSNVIEAAMRAENFVLISAPPEPNDHSSDEILFGCMTQGKKTLAKAPIF